MNFGNSVRVLRARWWVILIAALVGAIIGAYLAASHNGSIEPRWRAEAPVTFISFTLEDVPTSPQSKTPDSTGSAIDAQAEGARARLLLEDLLTENPRLSIQADRLNNILLFTAIGNDGADTLNKAVELRSQYEDLSSAVLNIDEINETIDLLFVDINAVNDEIAAIVVPEPEPEDPAIATVRATLQTQINELITRQTQLRIWIVNPELRPTEDDFFGIVPVVETVGRGETPTTTVPEIVSREDIDSEFEENERVLARLNAQFQTVPTVPVAEELDEETTLQLAASQAEAEALQTQYVELLQVANGRSPGGFFEEPTVTDETVGTRPTGLFTLIGFVMGALIASVTLVGIDMTRKTVWSARSLETIPCLGEIDRDRSGGLSSGVWYPTSVSLRRRNIQTFRAAIDAITQEQPSIVGFFGVGAPNPEVGELAADLAAAYSVAGREVLLIDANAFDPNALPEYGEQSSGLTRLLVQSLPTDKAASAIGKIIKAAPQPEPHLTSLRIDASTHDPIDAIASPNARTLMDVARKRFDIVIVAGPGISDPLSDTIARRIDFAVLTGVTGTTTEPQIANAAAMLKDRRTPNPGVVLLTGHRESFSARASRTIARIKVLARSIAQKFSSNDNDDDDADTTGSNEASPSEESAVR